jgi:hypothetical protein
MRRFGVTALALTAALVLIGTSFTGWALAKKQKPLLVLREGGEHPYEGLDPVLAEGAPVETSIEVGLGGCATTTPIPATIGGNSNAKSDWIDFVKEKLPQEVACRGEYEGRHDVMSLHVGATLALSPKGTAVWGGKMAVGVETQNSFGPCSYLFGLKKMAFQPPPPDAAGEAVVKDTLKSGTGSGAKQCKAKQEAAFTITVADDDGFPLETTLEG